MSESVNVFQILEKVDYYFVAVIIVMGAVSNALIELSDNRKKNADKKIDLIDFAISFFVSCFSGTVFGVGAAHLDQSNLVIALVSAGGAFLGVNGLNAVTDTLLAVVKGMAGKYGATTKGDGK